MTNEKHLHIKLVRAHIRGPHRTPNPGGSLAATVGIGGFPGSPELLAYLKDFDQFCV